MKALGPILLALAALMLAPPALARDLAAKAEEAKASLAQAERAVKADPHSPQAYLKLSRARYALALAMAKRDDLVIANLGLVAQGPIIWERYPELTWGALKAGTKALHVAKMPSGDRALLYRNLAYLYETRGEPELALRAYEYAEGCSTDPAAELYDEARMNRELGRGWEAWRATWRYKWAISPPVAPDARLVWLFIAWVIVWAAPLGFVYWKWVRPRGWTPAAFYARCAGTRWRRWTIGLCGGLLVCPVWCAWANGYALVADALVPRSVGQEWVTLRWLAVGFTWAIAWAHVWIGRANLWVSAPITVLTAWSWWTYAGCWSLSSADGGLEGDALAACLCLASLPVGVAIGALLRRGHTDGVTPTGSRL